MRSWGCPSAPINPDDIVIPRDEGSASNDLADIVCVVVGIEDALTLRVVEALAHEKAENLRLRSEREWLERRIAEEDARLAQG